MAPKMKLYYFNVRARGELIRLLLHTAGVEFEDKRVDFNTEWPDLKPKSPEGTLPFMEIDGKMYGESLPLARFIARKYNLAGKTELDQLSADIVLNYVDEMKSAFTRYRRDQLLTDEQKKILEDKFKTEVIPKLIGKFEKRLAESKSGFIVGDSLTIADLAALDALDTPLQQAPNLLDKAPKVAAHRKKIQAIPAVAKYLATRPESPF